MSERIHALAFQLFGKSSVEECDLEEIKKLTAQYPFFAPAQFLLLQKLKSGPQEEYAAQLNRAVLYYHNPLEFEHIIVSDRFITETDIEPVKEIQDIEEPALEPAVESITGNEVVEETQAIGETAIQPAPDSGPEDKPDTVRDAIEEALANEVIPGEGEDLAVEEVQVEGNIVEEVESRIMGDTGQAKEIPPIEKETETTLQAHHNETAPALPGSGDLPKLRTFTGEAVPDLSGTLSFEPYHTVDYFASQGIKISQEEAGKDKFGKQLKSFTEWLKDMKRLPASELQKLEKGSEKKVQHLADDSVHASEVLTEAMAEVWLKQGNRDKALEVYKKLSLLNPSKNAYFAAKIDNLKSY
jgi:hypothetical protein